MTAFPELSSVDKNFAAALTVTGMISMFCNGLILWVFLARNKRTMDVVRIPFLLIVLQGIPDFFLGSLVGLNGAVSCVLNRMPGVGREFYFQQKQLWKGPYCTFYGYFFLSCGSVSNLMHVIVATQRLDSVTRPLARRLHPKLLIGLHFASWFASFMMEAIPFFFGGYVLRPPYVHCDGFTDTPFYSLVLLSLSIGTVITVTYMYAKICLFIKGASIGRNMMPNKRMYFGGIWEHMDSDSQMFFILIICVIVCYTPAQIYIVLHVIHFGSSSSSLDVLYASSCVSVVASSAINPILCLIFSSELRKDAESLLTTTLNQLPLLGLLVNLTKHKVVPYQLDASGLNVEAAMEEKISDANVNSDAATEKSVLKSKV